MKQAKGALLALLLACVWPMTAQALTTYTAELSGSYTYTPDYWACLGGVGTVIEEPYPHCDPESITSPWSGTIAVSLSSSADGAHYGADIAVITASTTLVSFATDGVGNNSYSPTNASVSVIDGALSFMFFSFRADPYTTIRIEDSQAFFDFSGAHHGGHGEGVAAISLASPIPEPTTWALFAAGLAFVVLRHRQAGVKVRDLIA